MPRGPDIGSMVAYGEHSRIAAGVIHVPALVTGINEDGSLRLVAFSGFPYDHGWSETKPARGVPSAVEGPGVGQWRSAEVFDDTGVADEAAAAEPEPESGDEGNRIERIAEAIRSIPRDHAKSWTAHGIPKVDAVEKALGGPLTGEERDLAWQVVTADAAAAEPPDGG